MGVTPLLTNSQNRLYGAYSFINILAMTDYLEKISDYSVDIDLLLKEYHSVKHMLVDRKRPNTVVLAQKLLIIVSNNIPFKDIALMPYTEKVTNELRAKYNFASVTYRCLMPDTCYSWHTDIGKKCLHIPLITNEGCRFVYEDKAFHMPADGSVYYINNERPHSFMNGGKSPRIHITIENFS